MSRSIWAANRDWKARKVKIEYAPDVANKYCKILSFLAPLKTSLGRRGSDAEAMDLWCRHVAAFIGEVGLRVMGHDYIALTGTELPASFRITGGEDEGPWRIEANLTCPLMYNFSLFQSTVIAAWKDCPLAGGQVYLTHQPFNIPAVQDERAGSELPPGRRAWWLRTFGDSGPCLP